MILSSPLLGYLQTSTATDNSAGSEQTGAGLAGRPANGSEAGTLWLRNGPKHYLILSWKLNCPERKIRWLVCSGEMKAGLAIVGR